MDWEPPPYAAPQGDGKHFQGSGKITGRAGFRLREENKIRMQYCEDEQFGPEIGTPMLLSKTGRLPMGRYPHEACLANRHERMLVGHGGMMVSRW